MTTEFVFLYRGAKCTVFATEKTGKAFQRLPARQHDELTYVIELLGDHGPASLTDVQFASEARLRPKNSQASLRIYALKAFKVRLYGAFAGNYFICTHLAEKKRERIDKATLQKAADEFAGIAAAIR